jgi:formylglycine-generating enzyme required for sulfatase activity
MAEPNDIRREQIEDDLRKDRELLKEWEDRLRLAVDSTERKRYEEGVVRLKQFIAEQYAPDKTPPEPTPSARRPFEPDMVLIPAGEFLMGSDPQKDRYAEADEQPQHTLYLPDYYLARTPVTNAQYAAFVQATGYPRPAHWESREPPPGKEDHPVVYVSWYSAVAYCNWLAEVTGKPYRLPSEAEWEKGARGDDGRIYPWGDQWDARRCNNTEDGQRGTTPVGAYPEGASPYGLLDMAGNVWEWTDSWYQAYPGSDYQSEDFGEKYRVLRGGSWLSSQRCIRVSYRDFNPPPDIFNHFTIGFRVCAPI